MTIPYNTILITGGAGFVGSNLAIWLKTHYPTTQVIALDNLKRRGSELNLPRLREHQIEFIHGDIRNPEDSQFTDERIDLILECSAEPSVQAGYGSTPDYVINTNLLGTVNCLELARRNQADFIFLSTSRVYPIETLNRIVTEELDSRFAIALQQTLPGVSTQGISEAFSLTGPRSLYGATKLCSELLIQEYGAMYGLRFIINRCGVIAGPWQMGRVDQGVFALWAAKHYFKGELNYIGWGGQGKQVRDLLHIDDLAELLDYQFQNMATLSGETFNVGGGLSNSLSLLETTHLCQEITGHQISIFSKPENRSADLKLYVTDNSHITQAIGWTPRRTPHETLASIVEWLRSSEGLVRYLWQ